MQKLWLTAFILIVCCSRHQDNKLSSSKTDYKKNKKEIYTEVFQKKEQSNQANSNNNSSKLPSLSSYNSMPISNKSEDDETSSGILNFLSWDSEEDILIKKRTAVCEELLDINKIVVVDQNKKLIDLSIEKDNMIQKIKSLENKIKDINRKESERVSDLKSEIDRLNWLVKVLSSEIK